MRRFHVRFASCVVAAVLASGAVTGCQRPSAKTADPGASLAMNGPDGRVVVKVNEGEVTGATVNGTPVPLDRVRSDGSRLEVVNARGDVIGSMAQVPAQGPASLKRPANQQPVAAAAEKPAADAAAAKPTGRIDVFTDNPGLAVRILNDRELSVVYDGQPVPASQIRMENDELRIFNAAGDLLRIIPADSSRLTKRFSSSSTTTTPAP